MKIGFLGDICPTPVDEKGISNKEVFEEFKKSDIIPILRKNELNIGNLECPVTETNSKILKIGPNLKGSEYTMDILKQAGVGMVTLDNNHINDFGIKGIHDTKEKCAENDIICLGPTNSLTLGENLHILERDLKIGIITVAENEYNTLDVENRMDRSTEPYHIVSQILDLRKQVDYLILISHGGIENYPYPNPYTLTKYRTFADLGVDVVIGHHTHCMQGMETYNNSLIFYSLGNFFFPRSSNTEDERTGLCVILDFHPGEKDIKYEVLPYSQCASGYKVNLIIGKQELEFFEYFNRLSEEIKDDEKISGEWKKYLKRYNNYYVYSAYPINIWLYRILSKLGLLNLVFSKKKLLLLLAMVRNETHRKNFAQVLINRLY